MVKKSEHPDIQLFDYLRGAVDPQTARLIETHLSICDDCSSVAAIVRLLKESASEPQNENRSQISNLKSGKSEAHPAVSDLASFFYGTSRRADRSRVAAHVALCQSCTAEVAEYARGDRAAHEYKVAKATQGAVPATAWEMIHDWEGSSFAKLKPASEVLGQELLTRLSRLLADREVRSDVGRFKDELVPVLIVSRSGDVRSTEFFERVVDSTGTSILKHAEGSERFDNKPVHVLLDFGEKEPVVASALIRSDTIRLQQSTGTERQPRRADYFIIED
jgi:hypothetical protein